MFAGKSRILSLEKLFKSLLESCIISGISTDKGLICFYLGTYIFCLYIYIYFIVKFFINIGNTISVPRRSSDVDLFVKQLGSGQYVLKQVKCV